MKGYGLRQFYNNAKENGLGSALGYDLKESFKRPLLKGLGTLVVGLALAKSAYAGNGGVVYSNPVPEDSGTKMKAETVMTTFGKGIKGAYKKNGMQGAIIEGFLGGLATFPLRLVVGTTYTILKTPTDPVGTVKVTLEEAVEDLPETGLKVLTGVAIANAGSGAQTGTSTTTAFTD